MPLKKKVALNTLVQFLGKILSSGFGFLITIIVARYFGVEGFGEFTKITVYEALFYLISDFGLNAVFLKEEQKSKLSFVNLLSLRIIWGAVLTFIAVSLLIFFPMDSLAEKGYSLAAKIGVVVTAPTIITYAILVSFNALFQKNLRYDKSVVAVGFSGFITFILLYLFATIKLPLSLSLSSYFLGGLGGVFAAYFLGKNYLEKKISLANDFLLQNLSSWKILFRKSLPLGLTLIFNLIYFRADIFILAFFRSNAEVGIYGLAYKFFEFPLVIPTFFMNAVYPIIITTNFRLPTTNKIIKNSFIFLLASSLLLTVCCLLSAPLISLVKTDFTASILPFRILSLSLPAFFISSLYMWLFVANGRQSELVKIYGLGMVVNIILNLVFIPTFGYNAAAVITIVSEALILALLIKSLKPARNASASVAGGHEIIKAKE